ncbi:hypothetical protein C8Q74DRAFT_1362400 [Fomes fomentarius]|nr:hypothetical protein C8Q74DRAFT_1362400 [Fomes fomentarius]
MKVFSNLFVTAAVVALGVVNVFALTGDQLADEIDAVTAESGNLATAINALNLTNFPIQGSIIAQGLGNITTTVAQANSQFDPNQTPFDSTTAETIAAVFTDFVIIHQNLLRVIIGKESLAGRFGFTAPIAFALRSLEGVVDTFCFSAIALIPTSATEANEQFAALNETFMDANAAYGF